VESLLNRLLEDYGLAYLLESQDIEELTVLEVLTNLGYFDPQEFVYEDGDCDDV
jgi:hypothetical protein